MMQTAERTRFTEAEMATVRDTDLPDLLISLGYQVKRIGRYYTTQETFLVPLLRGHRRRCHHIPPAVL